MSTICVVVILIIIAKEIMVIICISKIFHLLAFCCNEMSDNDGMTITFLINFIKTSIVNTNSHYCGGGTYEYYRLIRNKQMNSSRIYCHSFSVTDYHHKRKTCAYRFT